jgi:hypothetical protein
MPEYEVQRTTGVCAASGRALIEGEAIYTVLYEEGESFRREDYALDHWTAPPEGAYCHFRGRVPVRTKKRQVFIDDEGLIALFTRLADETEPLRVQFRFVLALMLMRKRILKYEESRRTGDAEVWRMAMPRDQSTHEVVNPRLSDDQIEGVGRQLTAILHGDAGEWGLDEPGLEGDALPAGGEPA